MTSTVTGGGELMLMLLADARLPTGAHTQSAGLEPAMHCGLSVDSVPAYIAARLSTVTTVEAATAVVARHACLAGHRDLTSPLAEVDGDLASTLAEVDRDLASTLAEVDRDLTSTLTEVDGAWQARTMSPAVRAASRMAARGYLRLLSRLWPNRVEVAALQQVSTPGRAVVLGVTAAVTGVSAAQLVRLVATDDVATIAAAVLKIEPIDPLRTTGWVLDAHPQIESMAQALSGLRSAEQIPALTAPQIEEWAEIHALRARGCSVPDPEAPPSHSETRSLRLGVAGPVGTGKSSLIALLCRELGGELQLGVITNDIYTDEDARFLRSAGVLDPSRIRAVETGACPHTAIRDDVTANLLAVEDMERDFAPLDVVLVESGGDNLTATFSPALVDAQIFVLDVAGGGDVARKGGPGIGRADLLVVNKTDLAPYVGVDVPRMIADGQAARDGRPVLGLSRLDRESIDLLTHWVRTVLGAHRAGDHVPIDPGPMAPHFHADEVGGEHGHSHADEVGGHLHSHADDAGGGHLHSHADEVGGEHLHSHADEVGGEHLHSHAHGDENHRHSAAHHHAQQEHPAST